MRELIIDLFAGGGGASEGIEQALGLPVDIAINHDPLAVEMHKANHPSTRHYTEDVFKVSPHEVVAGRSVGLLWASPDCTHFSRAKGGRPVKKEIRSLAWVVVTWAQLVRPRVIMLENVSEFKTWGPLKADNKPDPAKIGRTFELWAGQLQGLGYDIEFKELVAADYGAPTIRKRLFMIARCDGLPIVWPGPTHGPGLLPYRTAAECIDFSIACPSIFERKRPLVDNTLRRIARGIQRYVIEAEEPFIVRTGHYSNVTGKGASFRGQSLRKPMGTVCSVNDKALVMPHLVGIDNKSNKSGQWPSSAPLRTITKENRFALVTAFLSKYYTGVDGADLRKPAPTVTAIDHNALVATYLTKFYGTNTGSDIREPLPTVTATGQHIGEVRAFLIKYYGCGCGQKLSEPAHTVTTKDRLGLVTVAGERYRIADIGLRMLIPRELARAQGFRDSYTLTGTKTSQVAKLGNSVCPPIAKALVTANVKLMKAANSRVG